MHAYKANDTKILIENYHAKKKSYQYSINFTRLNSRQF